MWDREREREKERRRVRERERERERERWRESVCAWKSELRVRPTNILFVYAVSMSKFARQVSDVIRDQHMVRWQFRKHVRSSWNVPYWLSWCRWRFAWFSICCFYFPELDQQASIKNRSSGNNNNNKTRNNSRRNETIMWEAHQKSSKIIMLDTLLCNIWRESDCFCATGCPIKICTKCFH